MWYTLVPLQLMKKIERIEKYMADFFSTRLDNWQHFYQATHQDRREGVYKLKQGNRILDFINSAVANCEEQFSGGQLIPQRFATPEILLAALRSFKTFLEEYQPYLTMNVAGDRTSDIVWEAQRMKDELIQMIDYVIKIYDYEDTEMPYQQLRYHLIVRDIDKFISILKSILASVSYAITKVHEGYFHSNVYLVLKMLGFDVLAEESTNLGRIDATIRFSDVIYIIEFKFDGSGDASADALQQIKLKQYAQKFLVEQKDIYLIGVSFGEDERNINGFICENMARS
jgi:PD-(D/E)XK nuclease superfamily